MKLCRIFGAVCAALGLLIALSGRFIAPVCEYSKNTMESDMVMKCHYIAAVAPIAGIAIVLLGIIVFLKPETFAAGGFLGMAFLGAVAAALPICIGTCSNPSASCVLSTKPVLLLFGGITFVIGIIAGLAASAAGKKA